MLMWDIGGRGTVPCFVVRGTMSEHMDLSPLFEQIIRSQFVRVNLRGVRRINSGGVAKWLEFVTRVATHGVKLAFEACSPVVIEKLATIANFDGGHGVVSVCVPYHCPECFKEDEYLVPVSPGLADEIPELAVCSQCGEGAELDAALESYEWIAQNFGDR